MHLSRHISLVRQRSFTYIVVVAYSSMLELEECYDPDSERINLPIRSYLATKLTIL